MPKGDEHAFANGNVMKWDWELSTENLEDNLEGEELEQLIRNLLEHQDGKEV